MNPEAQGSDDQLSNNSYHHQLQNDKFVIIIDDDDDDENNDEPQINKSFEHGDDDLLFNAEELKGIDVIKTNVKFIEVDCGCTNPKYGDSAGKLKIYGNGKLEISCDCYPGCDGEKISPSEFEKHAGIKGMNWKAHVWVFVNGEKVPLGKTKLLKYYRGSASDPSVSIRPRRARTVHRDELMTCTACGKERRFMRRNSDECKLYHQASQASAWTCSDHPHALNCEDEEERATKKRFRGCLRRPICKGCISCVCFGCHMCRFEDCTCRSCVDFIQNAEPGTQD